MSSEIRGVPLSRFEGPIIAALNEYHSRSNFDLYFNSQRASKLEPTPDKPNSARSMVEVFYKGENVGKLYTILFKPKDGTGSNEFYNLSDLQVALNYPKENKVVPRNKVGVHSELHLAIATHELYNVHAEPLLFSGSLDLLGLIGNKVEKIGKLGNHSIKNVLEPIATFTVGYRDNQRFGDPHSVYNPSLALQVCAFFAVSDQVHKKYPDILKSLNPRLPLIP